VVVILEAVQCPVDIGVPNKTSRANLDVEKFSSVQMGMDGNADENPTIAAECLAGKQSADSKEFCAPQAEVEKLLKASGEVSNENPATVVVSDQEDAEEDSQETVKKVAMRGSQGAGGKKPPRRQAPNKIMPARLSHTLRSAKTSKSDGTDVQDGEDSKGVVDAPIVDVKRKPPRSKVSPVSSEAVGEDGVGIAVTNVPATTAGKRKRKEVVFEADKEYRMMSPSDIKETAGRGTVNLMALEAGSFHGSTIPKGYVVVLVKSVLLKDVSLPFPNMKDDPAQVFLGSAIGTAVLWPARCVKSEEIKKKK